MRSLPNFDPTVDYTSPGRSAMVEESRSEAMRMRLAGPKPQHWPEEKAKLVKRAENMRSQSSSAAGCLPLRCSEPLQAA